VSIIRFGLPNPIAAFTAAVTVLGATTISAIPAQAFAPVTIGFNCVTSGSSAIATQACDAGENQFKARIEEVAGNPGQVLFRFMNTIRSNGSSIAASIIGVFFEDTGVQSLGSIAQLNVGNQGIVDFRQSSSNLPGAPGFTTDFAARSDPNAPGLTVNGINLGEELGIIMNINSGFTDPINAVITDLQLGGLRLGLRATGFGGANLEYSASFVNSAVPEPMTMLGTGAAIGLGAFMKRRQALKKKGAVG
jgi:hypothetical protein